MVVLSPWGVKGKDIGNSGEKAVSSFSRVDIAVAVKPGVTANQHPFLADSAQPRAADANITELVCLQLLHFVYSFYFFGLIFPRLNIFPRTHPNVPFHAQPPARNQTTQLR